MPLDQIIDDEEGLQAGAKPFLEHLEDLRVTLIRSALAVVFGMCIAGPFSPQLIVLLKAPIIPVLTYYKLDPESFFLILGAMGPLKVAINAILWGGLLIAAPFFSFFVGAFVWPGLLKNEKRVLFGASGISVFLFALGVWLGYTFCIGYFFRFSMAVSNWMGVMQSNMELASYIVIVIRMLIGFGLAFELPLIVYCLGILGLFDSNDLRTYRRHIFVGILVLAMLITPQDPITLLIMAIPLYLLFEITVWLLWIREKKNQDPAVAGS